jgi:hypothetical protein
LETLWVLGIVELRTTTKKSNLEIYRSDLTKKKAYHWGSVQR